MILEKDAPVSDYSEVPPPPYGRFRLEPIEMGDVANAGNAQSRRARRKKEFKENWRTLIGFWILGMCNNFGYVVMLSAAHDLLASHAVKDNSVAAVNFNNSSMRQCNHISTGAILLADIIPSIFIKVISPFFPLWINIRVAVTVVMSMTGFILVGLDLNLWVMVLGVICTSFSSGLGESSFLMYMPFFKNKNVVSTWSSGTGGAGVLGSLSYLGLRAAGLKPSVTLYIMISVPILLAICFWFLLEKPHIEMHHQLNAPDVVDDHPVVVDEHPFKAKMKLLYKVTLVYMLPFALVYVFEYFINQGLFELIYYKLDFLDPSSQYRWYNLDYQIGVLISRSSVNLFKVNYTWVLTGLQGINVILMTTEAIYRWMNSFWIILVLILWEGLLGGCSYVNTYRRINNEMPPEDRQFSMSINSVGDAFGIMLAGAIALPVHNAICKLPPP